MKSFYPNTHPKLLLCSKPKSSTHPIHTQQKRKSENIRKKKKHLVGYTHMTWLIRSLFYLLSPFSPIPSHPHILPSQINAAQTSTHFLFFVISYLSRSFFSLFLAPREEPRTPLIPRVPTRLILQPTNHGDGRILRRTTSSEGLRNSAPRTAE